MAERVSAVEFMRRNDATLAISCRPLGRGGEGAVFTMADDTELRISGEAYRTLPRGYPKWKPR